MILRSTRKRDDSRSPYHSLNLWRNPFGELTREERERLALVDVQPWLEFLQNNRAVLQFIGPCGFGKTTHLLAIHRAISNAGFVHFPEDGPRPKVPNVRPLFIDEAQRMSWLQGRSVWRQGGPLVLSTHVDLRRAIIRAGLRLQTIDVAALFTPSRLAAMLNRRIEASRVCNEAIPVITEAHAVRLQHAFGANIREIEHCLYNQIQRCVLEHTPWPHAN
jgi:hypothetical protein